MPTKARRRPISLLHRPSAAMALCTLALSPTARAAQPDATVSLPTVNVNPPTDSGTGPVTGYVARRSQAGTKTATALLETPQSIDVVPQAQLTQQDTQTLNQALHYTAGVTTEQRGGVATRYDQLTIRGFSADYYLDGLKLLSNGWYIQPQIDPYLLERIDVVKGPSSVLYGQAAAGGLIDQVSKLPTAAPFHEVGVEFGNDAHLQSTFDTSGPLDADGKYLYRITGIGRTEDGQVSSTKNQRIAIAPAFTFRPDDSTTLTLLGMYQHDPKSTSYGGIPAQGTVLPGLVTLPRNFYDGDHNFEKFDRTEVSLGYIFEKQFGDAVTLRSRARWFHTDQNYDSVYQTGLEANGYTLDRATAASKDSADQGSTDSSIEYRTDTGPLHHTFLAGVDTQHISTQYTYGFGSAPSLDLLAPDYNLPVTQPARTTVQAYSNQYGAYLQDQVRLGRWVVTLSGREDLAETFSSSDAGSRAHQWDHAFSGRAGLSYVFANGVAPYVSYAESFDPILGTAADGSAFQPERGRQYEAGVKYAPPGTRTLLTGALFDLERKNLVTPDLDNPSLSIQSGAARSRGAELEARASVLHGLDLVVSYTYLDTVYTKDNSGLQGKRLPAVPQHQASGWAYYTMPEGRFDGLGLGGGVRFTGTTFNSDNTFKVQSYTLVDGAVSYELGRKLPRLQGATLYLNGRNLLDAKYVASCYYGAWCAFGYGRQVMGGVRYRW